MAMQFAPPQPAASSSALDEPPRTDIDDTLQCWPSAMKEQEYTDMASHTQPAKQSYLPGSRFGSATFSAEIGRLSKASFIACASALIGLLTAIGAWWCGRMRCRSWHCRTATAVLQWWRGHSSRRALRRAAAARALQRAWRRALRRGAAARTIQRWWCCWTVYAALTRATRAACVIQTAWYHRKSNRDIVREDRECANRAAAIIGASWHRLFSRKVRAVVFIKASWRSYIRRKHLGGWRAGAHKMRCAMDHVLGVAYPKPTNARQKRQQAERRAECKRWADRFVFLPGTGEDNPRGGGPGYWFSGMVFGRILCGTGRTPLELRTPHSFGSDQGMKLSAAMLAALDEEEERAALARRAVEFDAEVARYNLRGTPWHGFDVTLAALAAGERVGEHRTPPGLRTPEDVGRWERARFALLRDLDQCYYDSFWHGSVVDPGLVSRALEGVPTECHQGRLEKSFSLWRRRFEVKDDGQGGPRAAWDKLTDAQKASWEEEREREREAAWMSEESEDEDALATGAGLGVVVRRESEGESECDEECESDAGGGGVSVGVGPCVERQGREAQ